MQPPYTLSRQSRLRILSSVQVVYALACLGAAVALIFDIGPAADVTNGTSVRVLGAALFAFAVVALAAARSPRRNRAVIVGEIAFTSLTALSLIYRIVVDGRAHDRAWLILPPVVACLVLLVVFYPRKRAPEERQEKS
jgi:peptidoglycan/LPS O-acetylase OafA/YrhL